MFERGNFTPEQDREQEKRFDDAQKYWQKALDEGRIYRTKFFEEVFMSPESVAYREMGDDELLLHVAKTLNGTWVGEARWKSNRIEVPPILPTSSS